MPAAIKRAGRARKGSAKRSVVRKDDQDEEVLDEEEVIELGAPLDYSKYSRKELQILAKEYNTKYSSPYYIQRRLRVPLISKVDPLYRALRNVGAIPGGSIKINLWFPNKNLMNLVFSKLSDKVLLSFKDVAYLEYPFWDTKFKERYGVPLHKNSLEDWAILRGSELRDDNELDIFGLAERGYLEYFEKAGKDSYIKYNQSVIISYLVAYAVKSNDYALLEKIIKFVEKQEVPKLPSKTKSVNEDYELSHAFNIGASIAVGMPYTTNEIIRWLEEFIKRGLTSLHGAFRVAIQDHKIDIIEYLFNLKDIDKYFDKTSLVELLGDAIKAGHLDVIEIIWEKIMENNIIILFSNIRYSFEDFLEAQSLEEIITLIELLGPSITRLHDYLIESPKSYKHPKLIDFLLPFIDIDEYSDEILSNAIDVNNMKIIDLMISKGVKIEEENIISALQNKYYKLAKYLIDVISQQEGK